MLILSLISFACYLSLEGFLICKNSLYYMDGSPLLYELHIFLPLCPFSNLNFLCVPYIRIAFFIYLFILFYDCVESSFLCEGFLQLRQVGATLHRSARSSHYRGLSCCGAQAPDTQAQQLWLTGLVALRHVGSSQTRARTRVPRVGRQILNHCATREAPHKYLDSKEPKWPIR